MCGKEGFLQKTKIEGTVLEVCEGCARFGEKVEMPQFRSKNLPAARQPTALPKRKEILQMIVTDYAQKIRQAREKLGLKQEEFAKRLNEKESIMQKIESGQFKPSIEMARKLERKLNIELIENYEGGEVPFQTEKSKTEGFTMGDFIKDKRKKQ